MFNLADNFYIFLRYVQILNILMLDLLYSLDGKLCELTFIVPL